MNCACCGRENPADSSFCLECGSLLAHKCAQCGADLPVDARFCNKCGAEIRGLGVTGLGIRDASRNENSSPPLTPKPLTPNPLSYTPKHLADPSIRARPGATQDERYADARSYTPKHLAEKILKSRSALEGERKQVTVLFADVKGSMELAEQVDPEDWHRIMDRFFQILSDGVHRYEGTVNQYTGDGIMALFGAPIVHEDDARRACYTALRLTDTLRQYADELRRTRGLNFSVRMGLNSGEVVVGKIGDDLRMDYTAQGHTVGLASRMEQLAEPGKAYLTEHTAKQVEGFFRLGDLGAFDIKGVNEALHVYELQGVGPLRTRLDVSVRRGLTRFVGRHEEMEQLGRAWEAAQQGHGQIVAAMGEAGMGKSRLFYEFKTPLQSHHPVLEAFSVSHGKAYAYLPVIELLKSYFDIGLEDDERRRREKITGKVLTLDRQLEDTLPYLFSLLGISDPASSLAQMDAQIRRQRTMEAVKRVLVRETLNQPLVVMFEDLHWIDGETQAFLDVLSDSVASARMLLLVNYRPEYSHGWGSRTYYTQLRLDPLGREEARELLEALLGKGDGTQTEALTRLIVEKTEGNPFFMEEVVQTLVEEGGLTGPRGGYRLEKAPGELHIPATVQGVLAARIDRLGAEEKELLQVLAVVGKEFPLGLARKVVGTLEIPPFEKGGPGGISSGTEEIPVNSLLRQSSGHALPKGEEDLLAALHHLQTTEFIYEQPAFPEVEYTFKHALTQEVAYGSVLVERRKELHERTARAMEELYRSSLHEHYNELAHHYGRTDNTRKAVEYLHRAGRQAAERSAYDESIGRLGKGLELVEKLPEGRERDRQELLLQLALGPVLRDTRGFTAPDTEKANARARELGEAVGDTSQLATALAGLWVLLQVRGALDEARKLADRLLDLAEQSPNAMILSQAHTTMGATLYWQGALKESLRHLDRAFEIDQSQKSRLEDLAYDDLRRLVASQCFHASLLWNLGYSDQSMRASKEILGLAQRLARPDILALVLSFNVILHNTLREPRTALEGAEALIKLSSEHGFAQFIMNATLGRGWALVALGQVEEGIAQMRGAMDLLHAAGAQIARPYYLGELARAYAEAGRPREGLPLITEATDVMNRTSQRLFASYLLLVKGRLLLALSQSQAAEAEQCFLEAIEIARGQENKRSELWAATDLARLWKTQGKKEAARTVLAEIYDWYTEGFDFSDLQEAKTLLQELS